MTSPAAPSQKEIVLVAIDGEIDAGAEYTVPMDRPLGIGRSAKGLQIPDPLVSIHHARISYDIRRGYVIEDLESATGTWVDEECLKGTSRPIGVGTVLRFGSTTFEVVPSNRIQPWMQAAGAISVGMLLFALIVFVGMALVSGDSDQPRLVPPKNQKLRCNAETIATVAVPDAFRRKRGLALGDIAIKHVTDYDRNDCSELWLVIQNRYDVVVTFGESFDDWVILGEFPSKCILPSDILKPTRFLPTLACGGTNWFFPDGGSEYEIYEHLGVVVFYRPVSHSLFDLGDDEAPAEEGAEIDEEPSRVRFDDKIAVGRFILGDDDRLASFLLDRAVSSPVHYVICEGAFAKELAPQVLFDHGTVQGMDHGCIHELRLVTNDGGIEGKPVAFALTEPGRRALLDDVTTFFSGDPEGVFLDGRREAEIDQWRADPGDLRGSVRLEPESGGHVFGPLFDPVPNIHATLEPEPRQLIEHQGAAAAPRATTYDLLEPNTYQVPTDGCADLRVRVNDFVSRGWETFFPFNFLDVSDHGCSPTPVRLFRAGYNALGDSNHDADPAKIGGFNVRARVETTQGGRGIEVLRARIAVRDPAAVPPLLNKKAPPPQPASPAPGP